MGFISHFFKFLQTLENTCTPVLNKPKPKPKEEPPKDEKKESTPPSTDAPQPQAEGEATGDQQPDAPQPDAPQQPQQEDRTDMDLDWDRHWYSTLNYWCRPAAVIVDWMWGWLGVKSARKVGVGEITFAIL